MKRHELSPQSRAILAAIAEGRSYEQILLANADLTYHDIFRAAAEALDVAERADTGKTYEQRMTEIRQAHPRAYDKWSVKEDERLTRLHQAGTSTKGIAATLQRQPSAIRSRLVKLSLAAPDAAEGRS